MNVYEYDIWEGDKGIIFADDMKMAFKMLKEDYIEILEDGRDYQLNLVGEVPNKPELMAIITN